MTVETAILVGAGSIGKRHAKILVERYRRLVIVDPNADSRQWASDNLAGSVETYGDLSDGLRAVDGALSTAVVATLGPLHRDNVSRLIGHGIRRIYCEKPLASSVADGYFLADLSATSGTRLVVGLQRRFSGLVDQVRTYARDHLGGEPVSIVGHGGAQCLITTGMHWVDLAIDIFGGFPHRVGGLGNADRMNPRGSDLDVWQGTATWEFSDDRLLTLTYSNRSSVDGFLHIYCPLGRIDVCPDGVIRAYRRIDEEVERDPRITRTGEAVETGATVVQPPSVHPVLRALDELESTEPLSYTTTDGARSLECALGALVAFDSGMAVSLPMERSSEYYTRQWAVT